MWHDPRFAEKLILTALTMWMTWYAVVSAIDVWRRRPLICQDPFGTWRAVRSMPPIDGEGRYHVAIRSR